MWTSFSLAWWLLPWRAGSGEKAMGDDCTIPGRPCGPVTADCEGRRLRRAAHTFPVW